MRNLLNLSYYNNYAQFSNGSLGIKRVKIAKMGFVILQLIATSVIFKNPKLLCCCALISLLGIRGIWDFPFPNTLCEDHI